ARAMRMLLAARRGLALAARRRLALAARRRLALAVLADAVRELGILCIGDHRLVRGHALRVGRCNGRELGAVGEQTGLDRLLGAGVSPLAHTGALADATPQVVELCPAHIPAGGQLDALDLRRVHGEGALDADPEGLLAHGEGLARPVSLALDD